MYLRNVIIATTAAFFPISAVAGSIPAPPPLPAPTATVGDNDSTDLFVGLNWTFGKTSTLEGVIGVMQTSIDSSGDIVGGRLSLHMDLLGRGNPTDIRLTGLIGSDDLAGELGLGLNFDGSGPFGVVGGVGNYWNLGTTIGFDGTFEGYVGGHSFGDFDDKPRAPVAPAPATMPPPT
ncbi:hypothetical protein PEL8287_01304 [Roseovarius litorisediminis]|uniref:Porin n=2 Tax=Roseovarius litorisediminis TaxID=1312363 RepID=A0A1Y5RZ69_9RHOB|nr:hypothetical protein PEL8287_01304 [Roseovarius litorisediminis]